MVKIEYINRHGYEKDQETGLHYAEARYYTDRLSIWLSVDPLTDKYPSLSSYAYCANNPVMLVDPDGNEPVYDFEGNHLGNTKEGFKGNVIIYKGAKRDFSSMTALEVYSLNGNDNTTVGTLNDGVNKLTYGAYSKIYTNILSEQGYDMKSFKGGKIHVKGYCVDPETKQNNPEASASASRIGNSPTELTVYQKSNNIGLLNTVENIENTLIGHEAEGHGKNRNSGEERATIVQMNHKSWEGTTAAFKSAYERHLRRAPFIDDLNKMVKNLNKKK